MKKLTALLLAFAATVMMVATMSVSIMASDDVKELSYAKDGLVLWLDGFDESKITVNDDGSALWTDSLTGKTYALDGNTENGASGWKKGENGGVGYTAPLSAFQKEGGSGFALNLGDVLPEGDYTVEIILTVHPLALDPVDPEATGTATQLPYYYTTALHFGDFRAQFGYNPDGTGLASALSTTRFYVKTPTAGIEDEATKAERESIVSMIYGGDILNGGMPVSLGISRDTTAGVTFDGAHTSDGEALRNKGTAGTVTTAAYTVYSSEVGRHTFSTDSVYLAGGEYNSTIAMPTETNELVIGKEAPVTVYSVRVYDRTLTEAERNANHVEDIVGYFDLDTAGYRLVSSIFSAEDTRPFMTALSKMGFTKTKAETQAFLDNFCIANSMEFVGISAEYSGMNGVRGEFRVKDSIIAKFEENGYKVEYGVLAGKAATHKFADISVGADGIAHFAVYKTDDGYKEGNYISRAGGYSKFALATIWGANASIDDIHTQLRYRGYLTLTKDGASSIYYLDGKTSKTGEAPSLYNVYQYLKNFVYVDNATLSSLIENFRIYYYISVDPYLDSSAYGKGDGESAATAYVVETVGDAYRHAVNIINTKCTDIVINLSSGQHKVGTGIVMDGSEITASDYSIRFNGVESDVRLNQIFRRDDMTGLPSLISSCVDISGADFEEVVGTEYYVYQLPDSARYEDEEGNLVFPAFRDLYVNGATQTLATSQLLDRGLAGVDDYKMFLDSAKQAKSNGLDADEHLLYVHPSLLQDVEVDEKGNVIGSLELWIRTEWQIQMVHIEHIDRNPGKEDYNKKITAPEAYSPQGMAETLWACRVPADEWDIFYGAYYSTLRNRVYWMVNNEAYLNEPGEWYYDRDNGKIYLYPTGNIENMTVSYPLAERLFYMQDMKNVSFNDTNMYGCTLNFVSEEGYFSGQGGRLKNLGEDGKPINTFFPYGAVYGETVTNITFENSNISEVGCDAINFRGVVETVTVHNCTFENLGGSAVRCGEGKGGEKNTAEKGNRNISITNNYINNTGTAYNSYTGVLITSVENLELSYNTILNSSYSAINVGWCWASQEVADLPIDFVNVTNANISHNWIENYMMNMQDGGAIYVLGGNANGTREEHMNSMNNNYVVTTLACGNGENRWTVFYHDSGSSHWYDYDNVLVMDPQIMKLRCGYVSYQTQAMAYNNTTERLYIVGYQDDRRYSEKTKEYLDAHFIEGGLTEDELSAGILFYGNNAFSADQLNMHHVVINEDGSYSCYFEQNEEHKDYLRDCYKYATFDDAKGSAEYDEIKAICAGAGCSWKKPDLQDAEALFDNYLPHCPNGTGLGGCWSTDVDTSNDELYHCNKCGQDFIPFH